MRKFLIPIVAAGSALAFAAPASAQWAPPVYNYQPYNYGNAFSFHNFANSMQQRVERIRNEVRVMQSRRILSYSEARSLDTLALTRGGWRSARLEQPSGPPPLLSGLASVKGKARRRDPARLSLFRAAGYRPRRGRGRGAEPA